MITTNTSDTAISLEERISMIRNSKASSPQVAAAKFKQIANTPIAKILAYNKNLDVFCDQLSEYATDPNIDIDHYGNFCRIYAQTLLGIRLFHSMSDDSLTDSSFVLTSRGISFINSMVLLALLFLQRTQKSERDNSSGLYHSFKMTLDDFWDAAIKTCKDKNGKPDLERVKRITTTRDEFMHDRNGSDSLSKTIADLLCEYQRCYKIFGHLDYILSCDIDLNDHLRNHLPHDVDKENPNYVGSIQEDSLYADVEIPLDDVLFHYDTTPEEYFLKMAKNYQPPSYDFHDETVSDIRIEILLSRPSYSEKALKHLSNSINNNSLKDLFDSVVSSESFRVYKCMIGHRTNQIYQLLVAPFLGSLNYQYTDSIDIYSIHDLHFRRYKLCTLMLQSLQREFSRSRISSAIIP